MQMLLLGLGLVRSRRAAGSLKAAAAWARSQSAGFRRRSVAAEQMEMKEHLELLDGRDEPFDIESYTNLLQLCTKFRAVAEGRKVHAHIIKSKMERERFIGNDLIFMYACFGMVDEARRIFDSLLNKNIFSWSAIIKAYVQSGNGKEALKLFHSMKLQPIKPDENVYSMALHACGMSRSLAEGRAIHDSIRRSSGMESDPALATALIGMYTECGDLEAAALIFEKTRHVGSVPVWNAGIAAYAQNGHLTEAFNLFRVMDLEGISPNSSTFVKVLTTCTSPDDLPRCRVIHSCIASRNFRKTKDILDVSVSLIEAYGQHCGSLKYATRVFCKMQKRDVRAWKAMIGAYVKHGNKVDAINSFEQMHLEAVVPDRDSYLLVLAADPPLRECKRIHASILQNKLKLDSAMQDSLARAYGKTKEGRNGKMAFLKMHKKIVEWRRRKLAAQSYVPSHFDFQD